MLLNVGDKILVDNGLCRYVYTIYRVTKAKALGEMKFISRTTGKVETNKCGEFKREYTNPEFIRQWHYVGMSNTTIKLIKKNEDNTE